MADSTRHGYQPCAALSVATITNGHDLERLVNDVTMPSTDTFRNLDFGGFRAA
jgi:hypothetical protein